MKKGYLLMLVVAAMISVIASSLTVYATGGRVTTALSVPHTFTAGTTAVAAEVNENFQYLADAIDAGPYVYKTANAAVDLGAGEYGSVDSNECDSGYMPIACQCDAFEGAYMTGVLMRQDGIPTRTCFCEYYNSTGSTGQIHAWAICMKGQLATE